MVWISLKLKQIVSKTEGPTLNCYLTLSAQSLHNCDCPGEVLSTGIWIYLEDFTLNLFSA